MWPERVDHRSSSIGQLEKYLTEKDDPREYNPKVAIGGVPSSFDYNKWRVNVA